jgi:hypothetical protein
MFRTAPRPDSLARYGSPPKALRLPRCRPPPLRADPRRRSVVPLAAGGRPLRRHRSPRRDGHHAVVPRRLARHGTGLLDGDRCLTAGMSAGPASAAIDSVRRPCHETTATRPLPWTDEHHLAGAACVGFTAALGILREQIGFAPSERASVDLIFARCGGAAFAVPGCAPCNQKS